MRVRGMVATETEISLSIFRKEYRDLYMLEILQALSDILYLMILHVKQAKKMSQRETGKMVGILKLPHWENI